MPNDADTIPRPRGETRKPHPSKNVDLKYISNSNNLTTATMSCLPYPTFLHSPTRTPSVLSLSAAGRVRVHPLTCPCVALSKSNSSSPTTSSSALEEYKAILAKCRQQARVDDADKSNKENAKLRKQINKEGVALASSYLAQTLGFDVSIVDVEIVLNIDSIVDTDGCLASCFLDAGCAYVVVQVKGETGDNGSSGGLSKALAACDATRVPRERLVLHWKNKNGLPAEIGKDITSRVGTISLHHPLSSACTDWSVPISKKEYKCVVQLSVTSELSNDDLIASVASLAKAIGENRGSITLVDTTAEQLGLCYAACMKTDRPDGLYTTVVCTRSNEALGLVYSSKVCSLLFYYFSSRI